MKGIRQQRGQVTVEVAVLFAFVIAAFVFMGVYLQRGAQGGMKGNVDSMGTQFSAKGNVVALTHSKTYSTEVQTETGQCANVGVDIPDAGTGLFAAATAAGTSDCTPGQPAGFTNPDGSLGTVPAL